MRRRGVIGRFVGALFAFVPFVALGLVVYIAARGRPPMEEFDTQLVVVEKDDSVFDIARRFGTTPELIGDLNTLNDLSRIFPDQVLLVPTAPDAKLPRTFEQHVAALVRLPPGVEARHWRYIVIHHSASTRDCARKINDFHRIKNGWANGLGYDFVIGNGSMTPDGSIEVGHRWARQIVGAHAKSAGNHMNETGIGICLVGNFDVAGAYPSASQMESLVALVRHLQRRYHIPKSRVIGHRDVLKNYTVCPGKNFSIERLRDML
ncbi:MAG: N-acetylmuramoyl-L-alanine amidase [Verrucomicrobia bacterium]|nr:N-acetylmuramoyl-L-alanine amidase [Verrucomicrobiota bacterium]